MNTKKLNFRWISAQQPGQPEWIFKYLVRKNYLPAEAFLTQQPSLEDLKSEMKEWPNDPEHRERLREMSNAWAQVRQRRKTGQKSYSFVLTTDTKNRLKELARLRKLTSKDCLARLIEESLVAYRNFRVEVDDIQARHGEKTSQLQQLAETLGLIAGDVLNQLAILTASISQNTEANTQLKEPQEKNIKQAYDILRVEAIARSILKTSAPTRSVADAIKRTAANQTAASIAEVFSATSTSTTGWPESNELQAKRSDVQKTANLRVPRRRRVDLPPRRPDTPLSVPTDALSETTTPDEFGSDMTRED